MVIIMNNLIKQGFYSNDENEKILWNKNPTVETKILQSLGVFFSEPPKMIHPENFKTHSLK